MKNYIKPNMDISKIESKESIASLANWLESNSDYEGVAITHYDLYAVES